MIRCNRFLSRSSEGEVVVDVVVSVAVVLAMAVVLVAAVVFVAVTVVVTRDEVIVDLMSPDSNPFGEV